MSEPIGDREEWLDLPPLAPLIDQYVGLYPVKPPESSDREGAIRAFRSGMIYGVGIVLYGICHDDAPPATVEDLELAMTEVLVRISERIDALRLKESSS